MHRPTSLPVLLLLVAGCVVPYGEVPVTTPAPAQAATAIGDLTGLEARVLLLAEENVDADRAARLEALRALLRRSRSWTPEAQRDLVVYLKVLLDVEERFRSERVDGGFVAPLDAGPGEETLIDDGPLAPIAVPVGAETLDVGPPAPAAGEPPDAAPAVVTPQDPREGPVTVAPPGRRGALRTEAIEAARQALARRAYQEALEALEALADDGDEQVVALRQEAVDHFVRSERERAGELFLEVRRRPAGADRRAGYEEVAGVLRGLLEAYPASRYAGDIARNLRTVPQEMASQGVELP